MMHVNALVSILAFFPGISCAEFQPTCTCVSTLHCLAFFEPEIHESKKDCNCTRVRQSGGAERGMRRDVVDRK